MRNLLFVATVLVSLFILSSCQKEYTGEMVGGTTPTGGGGTTNTGILKAKLNGTQWTAAVQLTGASRMSGLINVSGRSADGKTLTITIADSGIHVYTLDENSTSNAAAYSDSASGNSFAYATNQGMTPGQSGGQVIITSIDTAKKTISGTFSFKVYRAMDGASVSITDGSFTNVLYATTLPASNPTDTFRVKIDGADFNPSSVFAVNVMGKISISASDATATKTVGVTVPSTAVAGTFPFTMLGFDYIGQYNTGSVYKVAESGNITIIEHNTTTKRIRANFNFVAKEFLGTATNTLTEGYFSVVYQ